MGQIQSCMKRDDTPTLSFDWMSKAGDFAKSKMGGKAGDKVKEGSVKVQALANELQSEGCCKYFGEFNKALFTSFMTLKGLAQTSPSSIKSSILPYLKCNPNQEGSKEGFILLNTMGFWCMVITAVNDVLIGSYSSSSYLAGGYFAAYFLFWAVTINQKKRYMIPAIAIIALSALMEIFFCMLTLIFVLPAILYGVKAAFSLGMLFNAGSIYKTTFGFKEEEAAAKKALKDAASKNAMNLV